VQRAWDRAERDSGGALPEPGSITAQ